MSYDPFKRGRFPVGARTVRLHDRARDRRLTAELWYPAAATHAGQDLDPRSRDTYVLVPGLAPAWQAAVRGATPADGRFPLAVFSHGFGGHRRQSTFLCTHLASHGYVVASVDHAGNTALDLMQRTMFGWAMPGDPFAETMADRPADVRFLIDAVAAGVPGVPRADVSRVAMSGHSFGGWTSLATVAPEPRIACVTALAPAGGHPQFRRAIDLEFRREVPIAIAACERDSILPLEGIERLHGKLPRPRSMLVLENADHMHFCDDAFRVHELFRAMPIRFVNAIAEIPPFESLVPADHGHDLARGIALAQADAFVRDRPEARAWLDADLPRAFADRGIRVRAAQPTL